jgi:hypothetical protein
MGRGRPAGSKDKTPRKRRGKVDKTCNCAESGCKGSCKDVKVVDTVDTVDTVNAPEVK